MVLVIARANPIKSIADGSGKNLKMPIVRRIAGWVLGALLIAAGIAYLADSLYIRHQLVGTNSAAAFGNVRFYYATKLKNGKFTIYQDSPQNEVCVHALFPHYGYKPCWFASRNTVRVVAGGMRGAGVDFFGGKFLPFEDPGIHKECQALQTCASFLSPSLPSPALSLFSPRSLTSPLYLLV